MVLEKCEILNLSESVAARFFAGFTSVMTNLYNNSIASCEIDDIDTV